MTDLLGHDWTGYTKGSFTISASAENSGANAWKTCDSAAGDSEWQTSFGNPTGWWKVDLGAGGAVKLESLSITSFIDTDRMPKDFTIEGSNNDVDWDVLATITNETGWSNDEERNYLTDDTTSYRYFKVDITLNNGNGFRTGLKEFQLNEPLPIVETPVILPTSGTYSAEALISITCATPTADIYYTDDGTTPDVNKNLYTGSFILSSAKTIKAIGIKALFTDSEIASNDYEIFVSTDWQDDRNLGPDNFNFTEQPNKWGYLNNPKWTSQPTAPVNYDGREDEEPQVWETEGSFSVGSSNKHIPCGHWHKRPISTGLEADIYTIFTGTGVSKDSITAVKFKNGNLSYIGDYISPDDDIKGLTWYGGNLLTASGGGLTARLRNINSIAFNGTLNLIKEFDPFNEFDALTVSHNNVLTDGDKFYYIEMETGRIIRLSSALEKESRGIHGTVSTGDDSSLYYNIDAPGVGSAWNFKPPPANTYWTELEDQLTDSQITAWDGDGPYRVDGGGFGNMLYYKGFIYILYGQSSKGQIRKIDPDTFEVVANVEFLNGARITILNDIIHVATWPLSSVGIAGLSTSDLSTVITGSTISTGDNPSITNMGGFIIYSDVTVGGHSGTLYKLDRGTHEVLDSATFLSITGFDYSYDNLVPIDDQYVVANRATGISVFDITDMTLVDDIFLNINHTRSGALETLIREI